MSTSTMGRHLALVVALLALTAPVGGCGGATKPAEPAIAGTWSIIIHQDTKNPLTLHLKETSDGKLSGDGVFPSSGTSATLPTATVTGTVSGQNVNIIVGATVQSSGQSHTFSITFTGTLDKTNKSMSGTATAALDGKAQNTNGQNDWVGTKQS